MAIYVLKCHFIIRMYSQKITQEAAKNVVFNFKAHVYVQNYPTQERTVCRIASALSTCKQEMN